MAIDVSIIIVNYNTYDLTCRCIESIRHNTLQASYEIILVDNGSDELQETPFNERFPEIKYVQSVDNLGFAAGNNLGLERASGKLLLLLNSDTVLVEGQDTISSCNEYMVGHPAVGVMSCRLEYPDGQHQSNAQRFPGLRYKLYELLRFQKFMSPDRRGKIMLGAFFNHREEVETDWVWGTFFVLRKEIIKQLPGQKLDDEYFMYGEDIQWCWDIRNLGYKVIFSPENTVIHQMGGSNPDKSELMTRSYDLFLKKNYSPAQRFIIKVIDRLLGWN